MVIKGKLHIELIVKKKISKIKILNKNKIQKMMSINNISRIKLIVIIDN